jgi:hypothetical protein
MSGCWWWKSQAAAGLDLNMLGQCLLEDAMPEQGAASADDDKMWRTVGRPGTKKEEPYGSGYASLFFLLAAAYNGVQPLASATYSPQSVNSIQCHHSPHLYPSFCFAPLNSGMHACVNVM